MRGVSVGTWHKRWSVSRFLLAIVVLAVVVVSLAGLLVLSHHEHAAVTASTTSTQATTSSSPDLSLQPPLVSSYSVVAGMPLQLQIPLPPGSYAVLFTGAGSYVNTSSGVVYVTYRYPGHYLIYYEVFNGGKLVGSSQENLLQVLVTSNVSFSEASLVTVPVITLVSPSTPVVAVGQDVNLTAGFLQPPSGQNMTIEEYVWSFGNGTTLAVPSVNGTGYARQVALTGSGNTSYLEPVKRYVLVSYQRPGLYPVSLTIITENVSSGKTYSYTTYYTIAVYSASQPFSLFSPLVSVPNPGTIVVAENVPGGPFTFDPALYPDTVSQEVINNVFASLIWYYQSSTTEFIPMAAEYLPTVGNWSSPSSRYEYGAIAPNYTVYIFKVRPGLRASNGDPITAYDVWYSLLRQLLCAGGIPGDPGAFLAVATIPNYTSELFMPIVSSPTDAQGAEDIVNAVTYNNTTNTVTIHLAIPMPPDVFYNMLIGADYVQDAKWLEEVGDGINFTGLYDHNYTQLAEAFYQYEQTCIEGHYNTQVQWPSGAQDAFTGPYYIAVYTPGQSVVLKPNPYWPSNVTYFPRPNDTVVIDYVQDPNTALEMLASDEADIVTFPKSTPAPYWPMIMKLESQGKVKVYESNSLNEWWFAFNLNISEPLLHQINPSYSIPSWYFANPLVREAFAYAFNYTEYIDDLVGNVKYHTDFGTLWCGALPPGVDYAVTPSELTGCPTFNLTYAKELLEESGFYNVSVYFPIIISSGDTTDYTAAEMWAQALHNIDPNIDAVPIYEPFSTIISYSIPGADPMPIYYLDWNGAPIAWAWLPFIYQESSAVYPLPDGWNITYLEQLSAEFNSSSVSYPGLNRSEEPYIGKLIWQEAQEYQQLNNVLEQADLADLEGWHNASQLILESDQGAVNLYMYVYTVVPTKFWIVASYMQPYQGNIGWESNPAMVNGLEGFYWWWEKP